MSECEAASDEVDERFGQHPEVHQVRMGVDEARQHGGSVQIHRTGAGARVGQHAVLVADGDDVTGVDRHRPCDAAPDVAGDDVCVGQYRGVHAISVRMVVTAFEW